MTLDALNALTLDAPDNAHTLKMNHAGAAGASLVQTWEHNGLWLWRVLWTPPGVNTPGVDTAPGRVAYGSSTNHAGAVFLARNYATGNVHRLRNRALMTAHVAAPWGALKGWTPGYARGVGQA